MNFIIGYLLFFKHFQSLGRLNNKHFRSSRYQFYKMGKTLSNSSAGLAGVAGMIVLSWR